ncbi:hypothetical protein TWF694_011454 [Orbilia ellipsospora]|uniref:Uncharacterized protein n=1 Tax=Orbilia ellipsospora TaxID=2528407 RepID=A0AAV9X882_9PEZI
MSPSRDRNSQSERLLGSQPPAYSTFRAHSDNDNNERVFCYVNNDQPPTEVQVEALQIQRSIEFYRIFRYAIVALTIIICFTVSLPFVFKEHCGGKQHHHHSNLNFTDSYPAPTSCPELTPHPAPHPPTSPKFNNIPQPGSTYVITEFNTKNVITYDGGSVNLAGYRGSSSQHWTIREKDGWLGFTVAPDESIRYLGFAPWPQGPTLRCYATEHRFNEMFAVVKREGDGFRVFLRDGDGLKPLGKNGDGNLARVEVSDIWWGFTKVD